MPHREGDWRGRGVVDGEGANAEEGGGRQRTQRHNHVVRFTCERLQIQERKKREGVIAQLYTLTQHHKVVCLCDIVALHLSTFSTVGKCLFLRVMLFNSCHAAIQRCTQTDTFM